MDGQTDRHDEAIAFRNFVNAPKNKDDVCVCVCVCVLGGFSYNRIDEEFSQKFCWKPFKEEGN